MAPATLACAAVVDSGKATRLTTAIIAPALISKLPYDMNRDFAHVAQMITGASVLVAHPSTGFRTLKDLLTAAAASPGKIVYASAGNGTSVPDPGARLMPPAIK